MFKVFYDYPLAPERSNGLTIRKSINDPFDRSKDALDYIDLLSAFDKRLTNFTVRKVSDENYNSRVKRHL